MQMVPCVIDAYMLIYHFKRVSHISSLGMCIRIININIIRISIHLYSYLSNDAINIHFNYQCNSSYST